MRIAILKQNRLKTLKPSLSIVSCRSFAKCSSETCISLYLSPVHSSCLLFHSFPSCSAETIKGKEIFDPCGRPLCRILYS